MQLPNLDEITKKELNELTLDEVSRSVSYAYEHELFWYGINSVVHIHLMRMSRDISKGKSLLDEFIKKYELDFINSDYGFFLSLKKIEFDGIFIPQQAYYNSNEKILDGKMIYGPPQPQKVTDLGEKLIGYYLVLVSE